MAEIDVEKIAVEVRAAGEKLIGLADRLTAGQVTAGKAEAKAETGSEEKDDGQQAEPEVTKEEVRAVLAVKLKEGFKADIQELFRKYGGSRLKEIDPSHYSDLKKDAEGLGHA